MSDRVTLPIIPLRGATLFPGVTVVLRVGRPGSLRALEMVADGAREVLVVAQRNPEAETARIDDLCGVGVRARVAQMKAGPGGVQVAFEGLERMRILDVRQADGHLEGVASPQADLPLIAPEDPLVQALGSELRERSAELAKKRGVPDALLDSLLKEVQDHGDFANLVAHHLELPAERHQELLEMVDVEQRMRAVLLEVQRELSRRSAQEEIQSQVQAELGERQREVYLREQLRAIQKELGEDGEDDALGELRARLAALSLPESAQKEVDRELRRLSRSPRESAEAQVARNYLEWIAELPWQTRTEDQLSITSAGQILDEDHFGLQDVKDRVLEFLAVRQLQAKEARAESEQGEGAGQAPADEAADPGAVASAGEGEPAHSKQKARAVAKGPLLLFSGPPGVGKTSVGKAIAKALGRKYVRLALGGVRDEADIRGHRRTYVGAMPGRIVQALKQAGTCNPVILLDEVDKLSASYQGNPASALLEVLDPAQNDSFVDHYLNVPFDLSEVLFIATANYPDHIPAPLRDRMEEIPFSGYTEREKAEIARRFLIPRQLREAGLSGQSIAIEDGAIEDVVRRYTRESGVRQLEREFGRLSRKLARKAAGEEELPPSVGAQLVRTLLGRPRVHPERAASEDQVGIATGMYYTPAGGDIMFVEASVRRLPALQPAGDGLQVSGLGNVSLILTGQLGDVMKESARAALTFAATQPGAFVLGADRLGSIEVHVHVPAGAVPKDGPSAGVAMATALVSAMSERPVRRDVAMTGEITLRGRVLPIGGVKEKLLGAHRAGTHHVILPRANEADLEDLPADVLSELDVSLVDTLDEVLAIALVESPTVEGPADGDTLPPPPAEHITH